MPSSCNLPATRSDRPFNPSILESPTSAWLKSPDSFRILGVRVDAVQIPDVIKRIRSWIECRTTGRYIAVTGMHGISESRKDADFRKSLATADLVVPDGMPLVWLARWHKFPLKRRVYGPELMETLCRQTGSAYRHFFYGGAPGTTQQLAQVLQQRHGIIIAGTYTPPFRPLTSEEENELARHVEASAPDVLWVGLSTPKQEKWMHQHRESLTVPVMIGVGAAFDLNSGRIPQAPPWMREHGLEWLFRLRTEPRRLWRRYLISIPIAACFIGLGLIGLLLMTRKQRLSA
jgi:N-acetylglucosaminyldiphosphoundecaprenol N-acetyl-beta-D-mannosaminyltransferase